MSVAQLDDSEFFAHLAWLAEERRAIDADAVERLKRLAGNNPYEAGYKVGLSDGYAEGRGGFLRAAASHYPGDDLDFREVGESPVMIIMTRRAANEASAGLSDLLCWCRGYVAALPDSLERHPMSWEVAREVRIALQRAIEASE